MTKVITYGTFDLIHHGHLRLLERAKKLGDYLIVAVTADDFDKKRGKINVQQSLMERIENVKGTGLADEIIVEEYEGQKIDDIKRYEIDIFTVGSDWKGTFDYLKEYCDVVYLDRTEGISSTDLRSKNRVLNLGIVGNHKLIEKYISESKFVNGLNIKSILTDNSYIKKIAKKNGINLSNSYTKLLDEVDAVYIVSHAEKHYEYIKKALNMKKHILCETPICLSEEKCNELYDLANKNNVILTEAIKTAYSTAFNRLILLAKSGIIGSIISIDATCTSLEEKENIPSNELLKRQNSMCAWGSTALLPVFMLLGTNYKKISFCSYFLDKEKKFDLFTKINLNFKNSVATIKVGKGVKSEGDLIITGTKGYIYVPSPWWKMDYFEVRFESTNNNKKYFYQLDGEGIRYELVTFVKSIENGKRNLYINRNVSNSIVQVIEKFNNKENLFEIEGTDDIS